MATISTSGIAVGQIIRSEHLLRVINALNGVTPIDIIITGSLSTSGSLNVTGSTFLKGLPNTSRANVITYDPTTGQLSYVNSASLGVITNITQPGGSDTQVQYNSGSILNGNSAFRFIYNSSSLTLGANTSTGLYSFTQGNSLTASGNNSHAQGSLTKATNNQAHAEGESTWASGIGSHAEGQFTTASGNYSHAEGLNTIATGDYQHVQGQFNISSSAESAFIIGNGTSNAARSNLVFASSSQFQITGSLNVSGSITGSLFGTASFSTSASRAVSASWAPNSGPIEVYNNVGEVGTLYSTRPAGGPADSTTNVTQSIIFGWSAGGSSNNIKDVNFLGNRAGRFTNNVEYSNFFGTEAGNTTSASRSNFLGGFAGRRATNASDSNFFGYTAGDDASAASNSNFLGYQAGFLAINASSSNFFGRNAGSWATSASFSTLIGHRVGFETTTTASNSIGSNNIIIGTNITLASQQKDSINLGGIIFATGSYATTTGNPFSGSVANARVGIGTPTPQFTLDVSGSTRITNNLTVTGSLRGFVSASTIASTTASIDLSRANFFTLTLVSGSTTHISASNIQPGQTTSIRVTQPNSGTGSVTFNSAFKQPNDYSYIPTNASNAVDILTIVSFDTTSAYVVNVNNLI